MARIAGVNVPTHKKLWVALTYVYGIGNFKSMSICRDAELDPERRVSTLSEIEVGKLRSVIGAKHVVEGDLRRVVSSSIAALKDSGSYRGSRHIKGLPMNSRTRTNARTRRGKRVAIAGKKIAPK